jgi:hypothetical protein
MPASAKKSLGVASVFAQKTAASMNYAPIDADGHGRPERGLL